MPTACSPRNYASCTSMIGGRLRSVQIPAEGSDSHPFATCVCPIPVSVFHFPFFSLYGPTSFHQKSCHISPFSPAPPSVSRHTFLHFSSPLHRPFVLLHRCLSYPPCTLSFFHIIMYAHVCGCGSAASFASLQVSCRGEPLPVAPDVIPFPGNYLPARAARHGCRACPLHPAGTCRTSGKGGGKSYVPLHRNCWPRQRPMACIPDKWGQD